MFFNSKPDKQALQDLKKVKVGGFIYVIRKVNPLIHFAFDKIPQIFTGYIVKRKPDSDLAVPAALAKAYDDMKSVVIAGLVKPQLVAVGKGELKGKEAGITVDDLFIDEESGVKLYLEIIAHSLNKFKGLKGLFFSIKTRQLLFTEWRKLLANFPAKSPLPTENIR
jgi:hypothetical protein